MPGSFCPSSGVDVAAAGSVSSVSSASGFGGFRGGSLAVVRWIDLVAALPPACTGSAVSPEPTASTGPGPTGLGTCRMPCAVTARFGDASSPLRGVAA
eukprot:623847-Ditylum_brightwellii.AAC.1